MAAKAYRAKINVVRMNQHTCGGTEHLTPTLYTHNGEDSYWAENRIVEFLQEHSNESSQRLTMSRRVG